MQRNELRVIEGLLMLHCMGVLALLFFCFTLGIAPQSHCNKDGFYSTKYCTRSNTKYRILCTGVPHTTMLQRERERERDSVIV